MKTLTRKLFVVFVLICISVSLAGAQESKGAVLQFAENAKDLGTLYTNELEPVKMDIEFTNEGDEPLVISYVRGCCGTRIKNWTREPVLPGEKGMVSIEFRLAPRAHRISRTVNIMSNDPTGMKVFRIRGEVAESPGSGFNAATENQAGPRVR